jgi:GNAT superfamily N-acetyltransferase
MTEIVYRPYQAGDEASLRTLFSSVYGPDADRRTSAWRYLAPAPYPALIEIAEADGRIVGAQPSHAIDLLVAGGPVRGLLLLDVMTHPEYRRRGIFSGVVEGLRRRAANEGYRVLLTTPNQDAERGFARLSSWRRMGELVPWIFFADPAALLAGRSPWRRLLAPLATLRRSLHRHDVQDEPVVTPATDAAIDDLCRRVAGEAVSQVRRDAHFIGWRFGPGSGRAYRRWGVMRSGNLSGLVVTSPGLLLGRQVTYLSDINFPSSEREHHVARSLLRIIAGRAVTEGDAAVIGWFAPESGAGILARSAGFIPVPRRLRPRHYAIWGATDLSGDAAARILDLTRWHMTLADSDLA